MLVTFLVITLLQLSQLSRTLSLWFCIFTPSECPGVTEIVTLFHFNQSSGKKNKAKPGHSYSSNMIVSKSWDIAVLLCEIACCILLNVRLNNDGLQLLAVACEGPVKLICQRLLWVKSILALITDWSGRRCFTDVCIWISSSRSILSLAVYI